MLTCQVIVDLVISNEADLVNNLTGRQNSLKRKKNLKHSY